MARIVREYKQLERIRVIVEEAEYEKAIADFAEDAVSSFQGSDIKGWGRIVEMKEEFDGLDKVTKWAEVTFHRLVSEDE